MTSNINSLQIKTNSNSALIEHSDSKTSTTLYGSNNVNIGSSAI